MLQKLELNPSTKWNFVLFLHKVHTIFVIGVTRQNHTAFCYINQ